MLVARLRLFFCLVFTVPLRVRAGMAQPRTAQEAEALAVTQLVRRLYDEGLTPVLQRQVSLLGVRWTHVSPCAGGSRM